MAANVERASATADPAGAPVFQADLDAYAKQLQALDAEVHRQVDGLASKQLVTNHDAFGYHLDRHGLQLGRLGHPRASTPQPSSRAATSATSSPRSRRPRSRPPSPGLTTARTAETVAHQAGVRVVEGKNASDGDSLGPAGADGDTDLKLVRHDTTTIVRNPATRAAAPRAADLPCVLGPPCPS